MNLRRTLLLSLVVLLACFRVEASDWRAFTLESHPTFTIQAIGEGKVRKTEEKIEIEISSLILRTHPEIINPVQVSGIRIGLAKPSEDDEWEDYLYSNVFEVVETIQVGNKHQIAPISVTLEFPNNEEFLKSWVVLETIIPTKEYGDTTVYAHEPNTPTR